MTDYPKNYDASSNDGKWYKYWLDAGTFKADPKSDKPAYSIAMPPPNITGALHMGHALVTTIQDILVRWKRMSGFETLWIPGTDHASIATEMVVEQHLIRTQNKRKRDFSREEFLKHVWQWKNEKQDKIVEQIQKLGASCDWSSIRFTMDEQSNQAVKTAFKKLYDDGLIYRGNYLINWDPITQTALADDEIEHEERDSFLWHIKYQLENSEDFLVIATTRPETMLGDTAIAVNPKDPRYQHYIGQKAILPICNRPIPIIADRLIDIEFGTGAVKITPAHDHNDYQMGITHSLESINILYPNGRLNDAAGKYHNQTIDEARKNIVAELKAIGALVKIEPHKQRIALSYRSKAVIEPYLSKQWFVNMQGFAKKLKKAVEDEEINLIPKSWNSTYFHWIDNLRDWCISRQLWWGHRIPIWYNKQNPENRFCYDGDGIPPQIAHEADLWQQDEDSLDTWFSSALWPFSIMGWPEKTAELNKFYPISVLVTGHDILFFWVARMILMGQYIMEKAPFPETFLHGLIYGKSYWRTNSDGSVAYVTPEERIDFDMGAQVPSDVSSKWEKMSKTKGNVIDPLEMIELYGTDAVRMALCASATQARQIDLDRRKFAEFKNFSNKIWNGARFVLTNLKQNDKSIVENLSQDLISTLQLEDKWILQVLNKTVEGVNNKLESYQLDQAALLAYDFFWKEFCAYYLEICKPYLFDKVGTPEQKITKRRVLAIVLCASIRLIHPMAPHITEEIFHNLKSELGCASNIQAQDEITGEFLEALNSLACITAIYPKYRPILNFGAEILQNFEKVQEVIYTIRNIRGEMQIPPSMATDVIIAPIDDAEYDLIKANKELLIALIKIDQIKFVAQEPTEGLFSTGICQDLKIIIPLPPELCLQEKNRLEKELQKIADKMNKLNLNLQNEAFMQNAPKAVTEKLQTQLEQAINEEKEIKSRLLKL